MRISDKVRIIGVGGVDRGRALAPARRAHGMKRAEEARASQQQLGRKSEGAERETFDAANVDPRRVRDLADLRDRGIDKRGLDPRHGVIVGRRRTKHVAEQRVEQPGHRVVAAQPAETFANRFGARAAQRRRFVDTVGPFARRAREQPLPAARPNARANQNPGLRFGPDERAARAEQRHRGRREPVLPGGPHPPFAALGNRDPQACPGRFERAAMCGPAGLADHVKVIAADERGEIFGRGPHDQPRRVRQPAIPTIRSFYRS